MNINQIIHNQLKAGEEDYFIFKFFNYTIIEKYREKIRHLFMVFIDVVKAYDRIRSNGLRISRIKTKSIVYDFGESISEVDGAMHEMKMGDYAMCEVNRYL